MDIILFGSRKDIGLQKFLITHLIQRYQITAINGSSLLSSGSRSDIVLFETDVLRCVNAQNCLVILKNRANLSGLRNIQGNVTLLVNSANGKQLELVSKLHLPAISCGMSQKDTLTFSSIGIDHSVVSLQRPITLSDGTVRDPLELSIEHQTSFEQYPLLCLAAIHLFMNDADQKNQHIEFL